MDIVKPVLYLILIVSLIFTLKPLTYGNYPDFGSYYYNTGIVLSGGNPYMGALPAEAGNIPGEFNYPPQALLLFVPLTFLPYRVAGTVFTFLSFSAFATSVYLLFRMKQIKFLSVSGLLLLVLLLNYFPLKFTLGMGQINNFVFLSVVVFLYFYRKNNALAGTALALAAVLKVWPLVLFTVPVVKRQWQVLRSSFSAFFILSVITCLWVGRSIFISYFKEFLPRLLLAFPGDYYNQSLTGFLYRSGILYTDLKIPLSLLVFIFTLYLLWKGRKHPEWDVLSVNILILLSLVLSSISWQHHFVWALIPFLNSYAYIKQHKFEFRYFIFLALSYMLVAANIRNTAGVPVFLLSHVFYGVMLLYLLNMVLLFNKEIRSY